MYITIDELTAEGASGETQRLLDAILLAQSYIEKMTGQYFVKRTRNLYFDGNGKVTIHLPVFCKTINYIKEDGSVLDSSSYTLFNRYEPDDRLNPKIVFSRPLAYGILNIEINGVFGFIEEDDSTPPLIKKICKKLALNEIPQICDENRNELLERSRIISETTDAHSYTLSQAYSVGEYTGDNEIDSILRAYKRPLVMTGV